MEFPLLHGCISTCLGGNIRNILEFWDFCSSPFLNHHVPWLVLKHELYTFIFCTMFRDTNRQAAIDIMQGLEPDLAEIRDEVKEVRKTRDNPSLVC